MKSLGRCNMTTDSEKTPVKRRRFRLWHLLIVLSIAMIGTFAVLRVRMRSQLRTRLGAIRAAGHPTSFSELNTWYSIPAGKENAADTFEQAFSLYVCPNDPDREALPLVGRAKLPARTDPLDRDIKGLVTGHLTSNKKALGLLDRGAALKHSRYTVDFSAGFKTLMGHIIHVREGVRLLSLRAAMYAENGQTELSVRSIQSALAVARSLANEPAIVSQLSRKSCHRSVVSALERIINTLELTDDQLLRLGRAFAGAEDTSATSRALIGERCLGIDAFGQSVSETMTTVRLFGPQRFVVCEAKSWQV